MSDTPECIHGLLTITCVLCNGRAEREHRAEQASMHRFVASYSGNCPQCHTWFNQGDIIARTSDGRYLCEGCSH